jgi:hypothetical protein
VQRSRTFSSTRLDDEDILPAHALLNLNARLAAFELGQQHLGRRYAEVVADGPGRQSAACAYVFLPGRDILSELRMGASAQHDNVAHHDASSGVSYSVKPH